MKIHRFFISEPLPNTGEFTVTDVSLLNQWRNVLRMKEGVELVAFDGGGDEVRCVLRVLEKKSATLAVVSREKGLVPLRDITLFIALIKRDNFELVLEKATELGVSRIVPVETARSEKKGFNRERSEKILREAAEQSGRATIPELVDVIDIKNIPHAGLAVFDPRSEVSARGYFNTRMNDPISLLVGPEGGFTDEEIALFRAQNIPIVTTGPTILRAETAAIAALVLATVQ